MRVFSDKYFVYGTHVLHSFLFSWDTKNGYQQIIKKYEYIIIISKKLFIIIINKKNSSSSDNNIINNNKNKPR